MDGTQDKPADGEEQNVTERVSRQDEGNAEFCICLLNLQGLPYQRCNAHLNEFMEVSFHIYQMYLKQVYVQRF